MERHHLTADQAFALLIRTSQHGNVKLRDLAEQLVFSGDLPSAAPRTSPGTGGWAGSPTTCFAKQRDLTYPHRMIRQGGLTQDYPTRPPLHPRSAERSTHVT